MLQTSVNANYRRTVLGTKNVEEAIQDLHLSGWHDVVVERKYVASRGLCTYRTICVTSRRSRHVATVPVRVRLVPPPWLWLFRSVDR